MLTEKDQIILKKLESLNSEIERIKAALLEKDDSQNSLLPEELKLQDTVCFGHYTQGHDPKVSAPMSWIVVKIKGGKALLLSKYGIDCVKYHNRKCDVAWQDSSLRKWLNGDFFLQSFSGEERAMIADGKDKVTILSTDEIYSLLKDEADCRCYGTIHALRQGADHFIDSTNVSYWTKCDIQNPEHGIVISPIGSLCKNKSVTDSSICVRPAIWVEY